MRDPRIDRYEELLAMSSRIANDLGCGSDPLEISAEVTRVVHERTALEAENARLREQVAEIQRIEKALEAVGAVLTDDKVYQNRDSWELDQNLIAELREDRERLEWLESLGWPLPDWVDRCFLEGESVRAAIDAARKGEGR